MFSVITTASSMTMPIAIAIAPSVMRLNVWPTSDITKTVIAIVIGIDDALIAVTRAWRRKTSSTMHREHRANQHRVANGLDGVADERRLIVERLQDESARQRLREPICDLCDAVGDRQRVAADLARDVDQRRRLAVAGNDADVILRAALHRRDVARREARAR